MPETPCPTLPLARTDDRCAKKQTCGAPWGRARAPEHQAGPRWGITRPLVAARDTAQIQAGLSRSSHFQTQNGVYEQIFKK